MTPVKLDFCLAPPAPAMTALCFGFGFAFDVAVAVKPRRVAPYYCLRIHNDFLTESGIMDTWAATRPEANYPLVHR